MDRDTLQGFLEEHYTPSETEREAFAEGRWAEWLRERYPEPRWWQPFKRQSWREALRRAVAVPANPRTDEALLFGFWLGDNDSDGEDPEWIEATLLAWPDGVEFIEAPLPRAEVIRARITRQTAGYIFENIFAAPEFLRTLPWHDKHHAVLAIDSFVTVEAVLESSRVRSKAMPEDPIPAYSFRARPAFEEEGVEPELLARLHAALEALQADHDW